MHQCKNHTQHQQNTTGNWLQRKLQFFRRRREKKKRRSQNSSTFEKKYVFVCGDDREELSANATRDLHIELHTAICIAARSLNKRARPSNCVVRYGNFFEIFFKSKVGTKINVIFGFVIANPGQCR